MRAGLLIIAASLIGASGTARAAATDFSADSLIIPMDTCYQPSQNFNASSFNGTTEASTFYSTCPDKSSTTAKDGILKAYGLVYRLLQKGIPVYYILDSNKADIASTDLNITAGAITPVALLDHTTGNKVEFMTSTHRSIDYRGSPFIIKAGTDATAAINYIKSDALFNSTDSRTGRKVFQDVYIHIAKTNILQAPVRAILQQTPPKIALLDIGGSAIGVLEGYLKDAGLFTSTSVANYPTVGDVFTDFNDVTDFTTNNGLVAGGFKILWAPHWDGSSNTTAERDGVIQKISAFVDAGNPFFAQCAALATMEGADSSLSYGDTTTSQYGHFQVNTTGTNKGLKTNQLTQQPYPSGSDSIVVNPDTTLKAWVDPLTQTGDFNLDENVLSWTFDYTPNSYSYKSFVQRLVMSKSTTTSKNGLDIETSAYKDGNSSKGRIIYLGGHSYGSQGSTCNPTCSTFNQYNSVGLERLVLNTLIFLGQVPTTTELTRSAPIVYSDGKTYLGSYVQNSLPKAAYPPWDGHFREYAAGALSGKTVAAFDSITSTWDSATKIATQAAADSRTIFTAVTISGKLTKTDFTTANATSLGVTTANITNIRKGGLGGIDHSIPAVIGPSTIAGSSSRPTVAYVGALDGMLHAILISGTVSGKTAGDELWAFIPPTQIAKVVAQSGGVDGSPSVGDAFIDIGSGTKQWRTLLAIPDGTYAGGTLDVLDITDPTTPKFLWEASDTITVSSKTYVLGRAQGAAISPVSVSGSLRYAYFIATDNTTGTAGNGYNSYALDASTGAVLWRGLHTYSVDTTHNDVPGTVAIIDVAGDGGPATKLYFGDVEGKVWGIDATNGSLGTALYDAAAANSDSGSVNYPIESGVVLYRDPSNSHLDVLGVTGGADWVPSSTVSRVFKLDTSTNSGTTLLTLGANERVYAVPTIYGNSAYLITSNGNLQGSTGTDFSQTGGSIMRINLGTAGGTTTLATVKAGASEVAVDGSGNVIAASTAGLTQNSNSGKDTSQAVVALQNQTAKLVTVRAWLDLH